MSRFFKYVDQCPNVTGSIPDNIMEGDSRDRLEFEALLISDKSKEITNAPIEIIIVSSSADEPEDAEAGVPALAVDEVSESSGDEGGDDQTEKTGGLWTTGNISPSSEPNLFPSVEMVDSGPELDELLRDSPDIWETFPALSPPISQETSNQLRTMTSITRARTDALQEVLEDSLPWLRGGSPQHESNKAVPFDQLQDGDPRERESFGRIYRGYLRLGSRIEDLEAQLRSRGILWMSTLSWNHSAPPHGTLEIIEELNRLRELRVIQRVEVIQRATRWAPTRNNVTTPGAL